MPWETKYITSHAAACTIKQSNDNKAQVVHRLRSSYSNSVFILYSNYSPRGENINCIVCSIKTELKETEYITAEENIE